MHGRAHVSHLIQRFVWRKDQTFEFEILSSAIVLRVGEFGCRFSFRNWATIS